MVTLPRWLFEVHLRPAHLEPSAKWLYVCLLSRQRQPGQELTIGREELAELSGLSFLEVVDRLLMLKEAGMVILEIKEGNNEQPERFSLMLIPRRSPKKPFPK